VPMAAYEFALFKFPGKNALFLIALSALMVPGAVTLIPLYKIVSTLGWLNTLQGLAVPWMASPFALFVFKQFMESLPRELLDAAGVGPALAPVEHRPKAGACQAPPIDKRQGGL